MASSDDDEDLKRAIALSLGEHVDSHAPVINKADDSDDEDEQLRQAIALSLQDANNDGTAADPERETASFRYPGYAVTAKFTTQQPAQSQPESAMPQNNAQRSSLFGLDRKAMEQERLARLGKRKRSNSPERPSKLSTKPPLSIPTQAEDQSGSDVLRSGTQYPKGAVKRTWAYKHPRTDDIKIEEVFQGTVNIAVLSSFQVDDRWVFSKLPPRKTKQIWIMSAKGQDVQDKLMAEVVESNIPNFKPHFPSMAGNIQAMHSKLMLLFHQDHLRIVVPTANMIKFDWGETKTDDAGISWQPAVMENSVFLIDLPRRADGKVGEVKDLTPFGSRLVELLNAQEVGKNVTDGVLRFDFAATKNFGFVHSVPGSLTASVSDRTGLPGLATALSELGLNQADMKTMELDYAASSLGSLKESFLKRLYSAACGQSKPVPSDFLKRIRIYFPTKETVMQSTGGPDCGGIITLRRAYYDNATFPKQCMRDYQSTRPGLLSHNKLLLARGRKTDGTAVAWAYIGSANLSESAWGSQRELKSGKEGKLSVRNWECGVVVRVPAETLAVLRLEDGEVPPMSVFAGVVEIPFQYPGESYGGKEPWFFNEHVG